MEMFADVCVPIVMLASVLLGIFLETDLKPKKYFLTWIVILCITIATGIISVVFVVTFGNPNQIWTLAWLLQD